MINKVKYIEMRESVILSLLDLMDAEYQEKRWINPLEDGFFAEQINSPAEMFFDELSLVKNIESGNPPYDDIGDYFKTKKEAELILQVVIPLRYMWHHYYNDEVFLNSSELPKLRELSKEAFIEFMKGEKDNEKFCDFIIKFLKHHKRITSKNFQTNYENIIAFAESR